MTCRTANSPAIELAERLNLAESFRQIGWVEEAVAQLQYVAIEAGQLALPNLYLTSLMQLADLHLNMGQVSEATEVVELLRPFSNAQVLVDFEARLANTPSILHSAYLRTLPERVQRIVVVGPPGSGKTALARRLSQQLDWPHVDLDMLWWPSGWKPVPTEVFRERTLEALSGETWIADGNHSEVRDIVWSRADLLLWLQPDPWQVTSHLVRQIWERIVCRESEEDEQHVVWPPLLLGPNSVLLQAARAVRRRQEDYHVAPSLEGSKALWSKVVPLISPQYTEY